MSQALIGVSQLLEVPNTSPNNCVRDEPTTRDERLGVRYGRLRIVAEGSLRRLLLVACPRSSDHYFGSLSSSGSEFTDGGEIIA